MATFRTISESDTVVMVYSRSGSTLKLIGRIVNGQPDEQLLTSSEYNEWIGTSADGLQVEKNKKNLLVDIKTRQLIDKGFNYLGKKFSLSLEAQQNWHRLGLLAQRAKDEEEISELFLNGYECNTSDGEVYIFSSAGSAADFYVALSIALDSILKSGRDIKNLVYQAQTVEEVSAVMDNRIV